jgi:hypothetical protein
MREIETDVGCEFLKDGVCSNPAAQQQSCAKCPVKMEKSDRYWLEMGFFHNLTKIQTCSFCGRASRGGMTAIKEEQDWRAICLKCLAVKKAETRKRIEARKPKRRS